MAIEELEELKEHCKFLEEEMDSLIRDASEVFDLMQAAVLEYRTHGLTRHDTWDKIIEKFEEYSFEF